MEVIRSLIRLVRREPRFRRAVVYGAGGTEPLRSRFLEDVEVAADPRPAEWIRPRLLTRTRGTPVGSQVPGGFDAYLRVLHPAHASDATPRSWSAVAGEHGRIAHPNMQWEAITFPAPGREVSPDVERPEGGSRPVELARVLAPLLEAWTSTPDCCWVAFWEGYGDLPHPPAELIEHPGRRYLLLRTSVAAVAEPLWTYENFPVTHYQSPNLWWPEDRAWIVATEIDFSWTYIAGSEDLARAILAHERLEAFRVRQDARHDVFGDDLNPLPPEYLDDLCTGRRSAGRVRDA